jgi:hypothetical protein
MWIERHFFSIFAKQKNVKNKIFIKKFVFFDKNYYK